MLRRTHLAIAVLAVMLFLPSVSNEVVFIPATLIATLLPDIDTSFSSVGKMRVGKIMQFFVRHRSFLHSVTFCILISVLLAVFLPILAFPFFLGYSLHLLADSFTVDGIKPFWPIKKESSGRFKTGSRLETTFFVFLVIIDLLVFIFLVQNLF